MAPVVLLLAAFVAGSIAAAIRPQDVSRAAGIPGAVTGALVVVAAILVCDHAGDPGGVDRLAWLGAAAAAWTIVELGRALPPEGTPAIAVVPAAIAAALDPAFVPLVALAGLRLWRAPQRRGRWPIAVPIAGAVATLAALAVALARARAWSPIALAGELGDALGPIVATAALAGVALAVVAAASRRTLHALALPAIALGGAVASLHAGALDPAIYAVAAIASGTAIARLATVVHHPTGQAWVGATAGFVLVFPFALVLR